jgi:hypothetical protein
VSTGDVNIFQKWNYFDGAISGQKGVICGLSD